VADDEKTFTPPFLRGTGYLHHRCVLISESGLYKLIMRALDACRILDANLSKNGGANIGNIRRFLNGDEIRSSTFPIGGKYPALISAAWTCTSTTASPMSRRPASNWPKMIRGSIR
jgi:hypothetical protein